VRGVVLLERVVAVEGGVVVCDVSTHQGGQWSVRMMADRRPVSIASANDSRAAASARASTAVTSSTGFDPVALSTPRIVMTAGCGSISSSH
jgi:hypothetical protein